MSWRFAVCITISGIYFNLSYAVVRWCVLLDLY